MENINSIERSNINKIVLKKLRNDIVLFKYSDKEQIKEIEMANRYECSRTAIRNALLILEKEGLVTAYNNGTKSVSCLKVKDVRDLYEFRSYIEKTSITQIFDEKINDISLIFEAINKIRMSKSDNPEDLLEIDMVFHTAVIKTSGNKILEQAWINIADVFREIFTLNMTHSPEYKQWFIDSFKLRHIELMNVLLLNKDTAIDLYMSHIDAAYEISIKTIEQQWIKK